MPLCPLQMEKCSLSPDNFQMTQCNFLQICQVNKFSKVMCVWLKKKKGTSLKIINFRIREPGTNIQRKNLIGEFTELYERRKFNVSFELTSQISLLDGANEQKQFFLSFFASIYEIQECPFDGNRTVNKVNSISLLP
eukprot:TRINITY_DN121_c0_g3_i1.p3 TRINITY_DN121_c0_g3~~TRINITY_DN121_c0_g3_i1.p3  ORF type:complete len:137 (+),score=17.92 TRINITY_DN121_c0_g3_i1:240-650(+)